MSNEVNSVPVEHKYVPKPKALVGLFKGKDLTGNPAKVDESLNAIKGRCRERTSRYFNLSNFDAEKPMLLLGPSLEKFDGSAFNAKVLKDGKMRYTNYSFNVFYFSSSSLIRYNCEASLLTHEIVAECAEEIRYNDISALGVYTRVIDNPVKGMDLPSSEISITELVIGTTARTSYCLIKIPSLARTHKQEQSDDRQDENCARLFSIINNFRR